MNPPLLEPGACRHCSIGARVHAQRWSPTEGWHRWTQPTQEQIKARMLARRAARNAPPARCGRRCAPKPAQPETVHSDAPRNALRPSQADSREDTDR